MWSGRKARRWTLAAVAAAAGLILVFRGQFEAVLAEHVGSGVTSDVPGRLQLWARAIRMLQDFPLTGIGMNMFRQLLPAMYPVPLTPPEVDVPHAHNHLLQAGVDLGLPGLIAYLALWFGAAALLVRAHRTADERSQRWIAGGIAAGMIAYFAFGTADAIALGAKVGIFFWIALALIVSIGKNVERTA
jgi:putative inorganic carbon (HCO3(-)) transporter